MKYFAITLTVLFFLAFTNTTAEGHRNKKTGKSTVILELFTSEGCSSCPAADALLPQLQEEFPDVMTVAYHVDYWNKLGWQDRFSDPQFTGRQYEYADHFRLESVYTPQLIVNGEYECVGSNKKEAERQIKEALRNTPSTDIIIDTVKKETRKVYITCHSKGDWKNNKLIAVLTENNSSTRVKAGENSGRTMKHSNVVRSYYNEPLRETTTITLEFPNDITEGNWKIVLYSQHIRTMKITGAAVYTP